MKSLTNLSSDISRIRRDLEKLTNNLPRIIGTEAVKAVKSNFQIEAYDSGNGITKWPKRKQATNNAYDRGRTVNKKTGKKSKYRHGKNSTYKGSVFSSSKPLLRQTLALYNSIHYVANKRSVFVGVDLGLVPYAKSHNEGISPQPKRQYMPLKSEKANPKIIGIVRKRIDWETAKIMKIFKR